MKMITKYSVIQNILKVKEKRYVTVNVFLGTVLIKLAGHLWNSLTLKSILPIHVRLAISVMPII